MNKTESKPLIVETILDRGGNEYVGCADSDQDKFLERKKYPDGLFYPAHPLFHTYGYSIESLLCLPQTLRHVYTKATSFQCRFDFDVFFQLLSKTIYPLAITDLYLRSEGSKMVLKVDEWSNVFPSGSVIKKALAGDVKHDIVSSAEANVKKYLLRLQKAPEYNTLKFDEFVRKFIIEFPYVSSDNCVLFIYGHALFDFVVVLMDALRQFELQDAIQLVYNDRQMAQHAKEQRVKELQNLQQEISPVLRINFDFIHDENPLYQMIKKDLA